MPDERTLEYLRELEDEDERLARALDELGTLAAEVEELRSRASAIAELLDHLPDARAAAERGVAEAEAELAERRGSAERAAAALGEAERRGESREVLAAARREATKAADERASAERRAGRAREAFERLELDARRAREESPGLGARAQALAERMAAFRQLSRSELEAPADGLETALGWSARARGALFVARNGLETERERVVRQANELLATVTGEAAPASSVAGVRARIEART